MTASHVTTTRILLTVIGSDRPGLTRALAGAVADAGGNWLESRLSLLGGHYVGSVLVELPVEAVPGLQEAARAIDPAGLEVTVVPARPSPDAGRASLDLELVGQDRPGIVREVTEVLAGLGANIAEFESEAETGAWYGEQLFRARARVALPDGASPDRVSEALEAISPEIMVDWTFDAD